MAISKEKKIETIEKLKNVVKDSTTLVFVGFKGLGGKETATMRKSLRENGVGYIVAKKRLMKRVFSEVSINGDIPPLEGEVAIAYLSAMPAHAGQTGSEDIMAPAQSIREFEKQYSEEISILGGVFGGGYKSKEEMTEIASIPSLQILRGMFVNIINSPIQGFVLSLSAIAEKNK